MSGEATGVRTGLGWDSHRFKAGRALILGGVEFEGAELGLDGHSDADVLTHAVMDALLGAAGLDDIGVHFPDSDGAYEGADSIVLLGEVLQAIGAEGWEIVNVDATVLMERPKIGPYRAAIRESLASTSRPRRARGWASSAALRAWRRWRSRRCAALRAAPAAPAECAW
jgi:2-C-methyl-D-erythritol 2,4-cyclodiphosphate synthase